MKGPEGRGPDTGVSTISADEASVFDVGASDKTTVVTEMVVQRVLLLDLGIGGWSWLDVASF